MWRKYSFTRGSEWVTCWLDMFDTVRFERVAKATLLHYIFCYEIFEEGSIDSIFPQHRDTTFL